MPVEYQNYYLIIIDHKTKSGTTETTCVLYIQASRQAISNFSKIVRGEVII